MIAREQENGSALEAVEALKEAREKILSEIRKVIIGQQEVVDDVLACLFGRGHALLVGVPGLAKTLLVSTITRILDGRDVTRPTSTITSCRPRGRSRRPWWTS